MPQLFPRRRNRSFIFGLLLAATLGCGGSDVARYQLSGKISCDGQPVEFGWIVFTPERGPGASANIADGRYETPPGFGAIGGPHTIEVVITNRQQPDNTPQTPQQRPRVYRYEADLPAETATWDIELTAAQLAQP